jgi:hypothetical protein
MFDTRLTDRFAVLHAARPVAAEDFEVGVVAGELAADVPLPLVAPLGLVEGTDEADDDADVPLPDDAQPAASVAAATKVTPPSPIWKRFVIILIPFVLARSAARRPETARRSSRALLNVASSP